MRELQNKTVTMELNNLQLETIKCLFGDNDWEMKIHHSMLHGGIALFKTFCNVPSSKLHFFGEGPLHDHATTIVCFVHLLCTA
jgi:hypothetical protein